MKEINKINKNFLQMRNGQQLKEIQNKINNNSNSKKMKKETFLH